MLWAHKIGFKYDEIWREEGGVQNDEGWFEIPILPKRKSISEMKVHKRAYYLKRYELEKIIAEGIECSLREMKSSSSWPSHTINSLPIGQMPIK